MSLRRSMAILAFVVVATILVTLRSGRAGVGAHIPDTMARDRESPQHPDARISFRGDYEPGDRSQCLWCFTQAAATCSVTPRHVRQGSYAGVFTPSPARSRGST